MAVNIFPAPSTGPSIPEGLLPPTITYNTSYSLTGLSGMSSLDGQSNVMTYRSTDNTLYLLGNGSSNLFKFNLSTNTGSVVSGGAPGGASGHKDIVCAQDGTLYGGQSSTGGSAGGYYYSTNGTSWTSIGSTNTLYRGFYSLIDNGEIPNVTGNIVWQTAGQTGFGTAGDSGAWVLDNSRIVSPTWSESYMTNIIPTPGGGRADFPIRNGDDSPAGTTRIHISSNSTSAVNFSVDNKDYGNLVFQYAITGTWRSGASAALYKSIMLPGYTRNTSNTAEINQQFSIIGRPTTMQNRWIVGVASAINSAPILNIYDYQNNCQLVKSTHLGIPNFDNTTRGFHYSNPIYISATKKLYMFIARYSSGIGNAVLQEYDVTTYQE